MATVKVTCTVPSPPPTPTPNPIVAAAAVLEYSVTLIGLQNFKYILSYL